MIETDEDALICDLAETYHVFDYRSLPLLTAATLSVGLRDNSRIKMKMRETEYPLETVLLAAAVDRLSTLTWLQTKDGIEGTNRPASVLNALLGKQKDDNDIVAFDSPEAFEKERRRLMGECDGN